MRIIYFDIDSLRPDHLNSYGYKRETAPNIDSIAKEGMRFNNCFVASSPCVPSRGSFISGRYAINHGALSHWGDGYNFYYPEGDGHSNKYPFFSRYLREAGLKTATFSSFGDRHHAWWFFAGWNEVHTHTLKEGNENADEVNDAVIPWLKEHGKEDNYFLHIQYWDPHTLYTYPKEYMEKWNDEPAPDFPDNKTIARHQEDSFPRSASFLHTVENVPETMPKQIKNREDYKHLVDGYDGAINYLDEQIGEVMNTLKELGIEDEICFIITADHGESMGENGIYAEHASATEAVHHVPLIIKHPSLTKPGSVYNGFLYNVDVIATITDMAGLEIPHGWDGQSYVPAMKNPEKKGRPYLVMDHGLFTCQRAVRDDRWYFLRTFHPGLYDFEKVMLFDLNNDPNQLNNVSEQFPDVVKEMDHRISKWFHENFEANHLVDPLQKIVPNGPFRYTTLEGWVNVLQKNGRYKAAAQLKDKYSKEEVSPAYGKF